MSSTPTPKVRLTIAVTPEVHATFERLSKASNMSMSRAMGQWLEDTIEGAAFMAQKCEQARAAPKIVMAEMHAYAQGLADETGALMESLREKGRNQRAKTQDAGGTTPVRSRSGVAGTTPPVGNTGGKGSEKRQGKPVGPTSQKGLG